jgi:serine/threonine-protein kinase
VVGKPVDGRADVYSLGCVLFESVTGRPPFPRESEVATLFAHVHDAPPALGDDMPPDLGRVVGGALAKDPAERPATCRAFARAAAATVAPRSESTVRRAGTGRRFARIIAAATMIAVAAGAATLALSNGTPDAPE